MKRLYIVVEGQTEQEFVNTLLRPYLNGYGILDVTPVLIKTSKHGRGGHVNAEHLKNTINGLLRETNDRDLVVTTFVDFFRIPDNMPDYDTAKQISDSVLQVAVLEKGLAEAIHDWRFVPYIQRYEFEALIFSSNVGFEKYCNEEQIKKTAAIVDAFKNPEDINSSPETAPSKRLKSIIPTYNKVILGNILALEIGMETIMDRCPRFATWLRDLVNRVSDTD
ncbi:MAG: DUF4276 family protein [Bacteroidales bacterium]|nr:DUF4276 family protein [Bacteroidales bacterium]